ncbi:MAG: ABC transporter ATP-binding protein [Niameybacter sp.]|uniref:ABC transporter ATP-binding protein n=1 Tax=Niameybacter sp. TaxID=2033640 RepID=UPI002FC5D940
MKDILKIEDITVDFMLAKGVLRASNKVSLNVREGEIIGLVGESGSGKTTLTSTLLNIVSRPGEISDGKIWYNGKNVLELNTNDLNAYRWQEVAMIFQAAQNSMNPIMTIKEHFLETVAAHKKDYKEEEVVAKASKLLEQVRLNPERVLGSYPHQLSGGMKQRTIIALSLILDPKVLILDEPTTALDVITQAYIFEILKEIHDELNVTMIMSTHDVAVIGSMADRIAVMYAGEIVELGTVYDIFDNPKHPYTKGLITATPSLTDDITKRKAIRGNPPNLIKRPEGCQFAPRCEFKTAECEKEAIQLRKAGDDHVVRCCRFERLGEN